ncbi:MAG: hypothetical protein ACR2H3_11615, partial [Acidimicrobiales bacterium]
MARNRTDAIAKATEFVERLAKGLLTDLGRACGAELVAHCPHDGLGRPSPATRTRSAGPGPSVGNPPGMAR